MKGEKHIAPAQAQLGIGEHFEHFTGLTIGVGFDANAGDKTHNPMAGHANGNDIHPHNISLLPLISF